VCAQHVCWSVARVSDAHGPFEAVRLRAASTRLAAVPHSQHTACAPPRTPTTGQKAADQIFSGEVKRKPPVKAKGGKAAQGKPAPKRR
jgi:hypothetical protein